MDKCEGCPMSYINVRDISDAKPWCVEFDNYCGSIKTCHMSPASMNAIRVKIRGEADRLAPMKTCGFCHLGEVWDPEAHFQLSECCHCHGAGEIEWWGE